VVTAVVPGAGVTYQVPVKVSDGVVSAGVEVYSSVSLVRPSGSVRVDVVVPPAGGMTVVRSPL
jgi:hypothetical protein